MRITYLCQLVGVSRSGYYNWKQNQQKRQEREDKDLEDYQQIVSVFLARGKYQRGSRSIKMALKHKGIIMNRKKIQRLMRKFGLHCTLRAPNPYKKMARAKKEHATKPNLLNRQFDVSQAGQVLLTDITYLFYGQQRRAYLSVIKDSGTHQILGYSLSESLKIDFVLETLVRAKRHHDIKKDALIHSDQGIHYQSIAFQDLVENYELRQSMSRRGNCWDNAPQESFFGHMKDEVGDLTQIKTFTDLEQEISDYMDYYNEERYQVGLEELSPNQYAEYLKTGVHPLR